MESFLCEDQQSFSNIHSPKTKPEGSHVTHNMNHLCGRLNNLEAVIIVARAELADTSSSFQKRLPKHVAVSVVVYAVPPDVDLGHRALLFRSYMIL